MTKLKKILSIGWLSFAVMFVSKNANATVKPDIANRINKIRMEIKNKSANPEATNLKDHFSSNLLAQWGNWVNWNNWNNWNQWNQWVSFSNY
jgi:hypothetical protein